MVSSGRRVRDDQQVSGPIDPRDVVIPHTRPIAPAVSVRSTLLQSSLATLKQQGFFERYLELLDPAYRTVIIEAIAPAWLPIEAGIAHYRACDRLALSDAEMIAIGEQVGERMQGPFMDALTRAARTMGVTPWGLVKRFHVLWSRMFQGGSFEVLKLGPKDLTIEILGASLTHYAYFRHALCGVVRGAATHVGVRVAYVRIVRWDANHDRFVMRAAWV
ncbi:MAG: hypothetical protein JWN48_4545 [Myxococcaceae bacterium]|nr:hypothetical protein [Myxococcaceae bacterium]